MKKCRAHEFTVANKQARLERSCLLLRRYPASLQCISSGLRTKNYSHLLLLAILKMIVYMEQLELERDILQPIAFYAHVRRLGNPSWCPRVFFLSAARQFILLNRG